ncbi:hypothetical protein cyc_07084 [Cyclospora cayetanensis]|uniref:Uncharacterized protein n=1 Tax=Cyclospora cayetanensis TaxID=88456 RepID=A0A1D3DA33_9EIME|nr:hypothetical protein cyc_07084 [Cyclospora cayetanensis]
MSVPSRLCVAPPLEELLVALYCRCFRLYSLHKLWFPQLSRSCSSPCIAKCGVLLVRCNRRSFRKVRGSSVGQSSTGVVCTKAAGTGGPKAVHCPESPEGWDSVCFLVVPSNCDAVKLKIQPKARKGRARLRQRGRGASSAWDAAQRDGEHIGS